MKYVTDRKVLKIDSYRQWESRPDSDGYVLSFCDYGLRSWFEFPRTARRIELVLSTNPSQGYEIVRNAEGHLTMVSPSGEDTLYLCAAESHWFAKFLDKFPNVTNVYASLEY